MASWKPKHVAKYCLKLQTYFINCCVVTVFNKEIYIVNTTGCIHWKLSVSFRLIQVYHAFFPPRDIIHYTLSKTSLRLPHTLSSKQHGKKIRVFNVVSGTETWAENIIQKLSNEDAEMYGTLWCWRSLKAILGAAGTLLTGLYDATHRQFLAPIGGEGLLVLQ
jgi:hypothetical protein